MAGIRAVVLEADDTAAAREFYDKAFDLGDRLRVRPAQDPTSGFRGFTMSLVVSQPGTVDALADSAVESGAKILNKQFYVDKGLAAGKSYGGKYAELDTGDSGVKLALYPRKAAAKNAGVDPAGSGSHRLAIVGDLGTLADPDGFEWEAP